MKRRTPTGIKALRAIGISITLIVLIVLGSVLYSGYKNFETVAGDLNGSNPQSYSTKTTMQGVQATVSANFTIQNNGFYTLSLSMVCDSVQASQLTCNQAQVSVPAGQQGVLEFKMVIANITQFASSGHGSAKGTLTIEQVPFASISVGLELGHLVGQGGG